MKGMVRVAVFLCLLVCVGGQALAQEVAPGEAQRASAGGEVTPQEALQTLLTAEVFEDVRVGYAGQLSTNVRALRVLYASPEAKTLLVKLGQEGSTVGQLYAAIGLHDLDKAAAAQVRQVLRGKSEQHVLSQMGCLGGGFKVGELLERQEPDAVRLQPGQSLEDWFKAHKSGRLDIAGGGYSASFLHGR